MSLISKSKSSLWHLPGVGDVKIKRNPKAKRLSISVHPHNGVRVTIPSYISLAIAKSFVEQKKEWIVSKQHELAKRVDSKAITSGYKTREHELIFVPTNEPKIRLAIESSKALLYYPISISNTSSEIQEAARVSIENLYRLEAKRYLPHRVDQLATQHNFKYNALRIKNIKSRWGSCSGQNNINLSIYLMKLPNDLIDYIILHELTHTIHKNHGPNFWKHLDRISGNAKGLNARVKKYRTGV